MFTLIIKGRSFSLVKRLSDLRNRLSRTIKRSSKSYLNERGWKKQARFQARNISGTTDAPMVHGKDEY